MKRVEDEICIEVRPEDRIALRRSLHADARLSFEGRGSSEGVVTDLSVHGLWVAVHRALPLRARVKIAFRPAAGFDEISLDAVVARVDWHEGTEGVMGMGLSFVSLHPHDQDVLEDALKGLPPRVPSEVSPVIALVEHDSLEDEVEQILDEDDLREIEESGVRAIVVAGGSDEEFELLGDDEVFVLG